MRLDVFSFHFFQNKIWPKQLLRRRRSFALHLRGPITSGETGGGLASVTSPGGKLMWLLDRSQMEGWRRNEGLTKEPEPLSDRARGEEGRRGRRSVFSQTLRTSPPFDPVLWLLFFFLSFTAPCVLVAVQMILLCGALLSSSTAANLQSLRRGRLTFQIISDPPPPPSPPHSETSSSLIYDTSNMYPPTPVCLEVRFLQARSSPLALAHVGGLSQTFCNELGQRKEGSF